MDKVGAPGGKLAIGLHRCSILQEMIFLIGLFFERTSLNRRDFRISVIQLRTAYMY